MKGLKLYLFQIILIKVWFTNIQQRIPAYQISKQWLEETGYYEEHFPQSETVAQRYSVKMVFWKTSENLLENAITRVSFLNKVATETCNFIKKEALIEDCVASTFLFIKRERKK